MQEQELKDLLQRIRNGTATAEEKVFLENWYLQYREKDVAEYSLDDRLEDADAIWAKLQPVVAKSRHRKFWPRIAVAASILLFSFIGGYFLFHKQILSQIARNKIHDIAPGSNKAVLTLANGKTIVLNGARNGKLAVQGYTAINKTADGKVVYNADQSASEKAANEVVYNTLTTPRGGQYYLVLADGTNVWLNAASSIVFPATFSGSDREVKITGEAYFEVAHNATKPFKVTANGQTVEVLGTHFNINAYRDEPNIKTTLFEGSIKINSGTGQAILKPGQQAQISENRINVVSDTNMNEAIAWHKGLFEFHDADIQTVMRQLSRWYDVDVSYDGKITDRRFSGKLYRNITALTVADILSYKKIHFRIEGKRIIVEP
jgi:transmembrane sensor